MTKLLTLAETNKRIENGEAMMIAASPEFLQQLKAGRWIAGSIPYFMTSEGGLFSKDRALVSDVADFATDVRIQEYSDKELAQIPKDYFKNGFSLIIVPCQSAAHLEFSMKSFTYENIFTGNLLGWVSGVDLGDPQAVPIVYNGLSHKKITDKAIVMHVELPATKVARTNIINIFSQGQGDRIEFLASGFSVKKCLVNGEETLFSEYIRGRQIGMQLPLVADYSGASINVSLKSVDEADKKVELYAPVVPNVVYRFAKPIADYEKAFDEQVQKLEGVTSDFACNCILNYLYAKMEGKKCGLQGPMTFGEIAYITLNQTLVYLSVVDQN